MIEKPVPEYYFNEKANSIAANLFFHEKIRNIKVDYHLVKDEVTVGKKYQLLRLNNKSTDKHLYKRS